MSELFAGVEDPDMRRYLEEMSGGGKSAVYSMAYEKAARAGKTDAEAVCAGGRSRTQERLRL